jgi:hypothetical protein
VDFHSDRTPNFLRFIKRELIPEVNARFNKGVNSKGDRVLIGHSSGGYFSTHALYQNELDTVYSINNYVSVNLKLFMGVGGSEEERFLITFNSLKDSLISRNYTDLHLETNIYDGHDHSSYITQAVHDGLIFLFRP